MRRTVIDSRKSQQTVLAPRERVAAASRIVVKVGTNVIMRDDGSVSIGVLYGIAESLANLRRAGREVLLVSSGAVGLGAQRLALASRPTEGGLDSGLRRGRPEPPDEHVRRRLREAGLPRRASAADRGRFPRRARGTKICAPR